MLMHADASASALQGYSSGCLPPCCSTLLGTTRSCLEAWRLLAAQRRSAASKVAYARDRTRRRLACNILHAWWLAQWRQPLEQDAAAFCRAWSQRRALAAWQQHVQQQQLLASVVVGRWASLHVSAAWQAWRQWLQQQKGKRQRAQAVAAHWHNLALAAAFHAWRDLRRAKQQRQELGRAISSRWSNLHAAAALTAWRAYVLQRQRHREAHEQVSLRWRNLHLAAAVAGWREATAEAAGRAAVADAAMQRRLGAACGAALGAWRQLAARHAGLRSNAGTVATRWQQRQLSGALAAWRQAVQWRCTKQLAGQHWRRLLLGSLLRLWRVYALRKASHARVRGSIGVGT